MLATNLCHQDCLALNSPNVPITWDMLTPEPKKHFKKEKSSGLVPGMFFSNLKGHLIISIMMLPITT